MVRVQLAGAAFSFVLAASSLVVGCAPGNAIGRVSIPTVEVDVRDVLGHPIDASEPDALEEGHAAGDLVAVEWRGTWWPAVLVERRRAGWMVHYDGYSKEWDEVVTLARIRDRQAPVEEPSIEPMDEGVDP